jgi:hypothetical protein
VGSGTASPVVAQASLWNARASRIPRSHSSTVSSPAESRGVSSRRVARRRRCRTSHR